MFAAVPRYDGTNKEECVVWINWILSLVVSAGCNLRLELLNRLEGDVTTIIAGMDDNVSDEDLKEEIMICVSNALTMIQAIGVLRGIQQRQNEQAHLYAARYEFVHNRANNITPEEQTQVSEIIHYASTLLPHLKKKLLKKLNTYHRPKMFREVMDVTIGNISVEQIATSLRSDPDHLVEALEDVFTAPQSMEEQDTQEQESQ